jgi:hypothetical protein
MSEKMRFYILFGLLVLSIALLAYAKTHIGPDFIKQL